MRPALSRLCLDLADAANDSYYSEGGDGFFTLDLDLPRVDADFEIVASSRLLKCDAHGLDGPCDRSNEEIAVLKVCPWESTNRSLA